MHNQVKSGMLSLSTSAHNANVQHSQHCGSVALQSQVCTVVCSARTIPACGGGQGHVYLAAPFLRCDPKGVEIDGGLCACRPSRVRHRNSACWRMRCGVGHWRGSTRCSTAHPAAGCPSGWPPSCRPPKVPPVIPGGWGGGGGGVYLIIRPCQPWNSHVMRVMLVMLCFSHYSSCPVEQW